MRLDGNDYSVHPAVIGRRVEVAADLDRVRVSCDGQLVADHARCWAPHQTITDPAHLAAADALRRDRRRPCVQPTDPARSRSSCDCSADYDTAFGLDTMRGRPDGRPTTTTAAERGTSPPSSRS